MPGKGVAARNADRRELRNDLLKACFALLLGVLLNPLSKALEKQVKLPVTLWFFILGVGVLALVVLALLRVSKRYLVFGAFGVCFASLGAVVLEQQRQPSIDVEVGGRRVAGFSPQEDFTAAVAVRPGDRLELDVKLKGKGDIDEDTKVAVTVPRNPDGTTLPRVVALHAGLRRDADDQLRLQISDEGLVRLGRPTRFRYRRRTALLQSEDGWQALDTPPAEETTRQFHVEIPSASFGLSNRFKEVQFEFLVDVEAG